jgi:putative queuosine salvage protein
MPVELKKNVGKGKHAMTDMKRWLDADEGNSYSLPVHDMLGVLSSTRNVVKQSEHVWINPEQIDKLSGQWREAMQAGTQNAVPSTALWDNRYHFNDGTERTVNWVLVLDALNFCFWAEKDQPRWSIDYKGEILNGYWAEAAALKRAVEEGIPLWDAEYLSTIPRQTVTAIFRGTPTSPIIPLFEQRVHILHETGRVLLERFRGQFATAVEQSQGSAVQLVLLLAQHFPSFHDVASYRNQQVRFFKRAQICAADLYGTFCGKQWGAFMDTDQLTIFADYKLPQVLRQYSIIEYGSSLAAKVDNQELLKPESEEEIEIRAAAIWACELLRQSMQQQGYRISAAEIDQRLWLLGQQLAQARPYHRTRTIYY